ncbi:WecB/TagA/CpsF family glycosyltransferase [Arthrobacter sp. KN11-1C]|uniref:WecB/TagA/CpsF family glycosyltransferase n=1 Tax=Arthrobacter sp. KN11-1C TaxID=3445774 RepID=UPI003FA0B7A6
MSEKSDAGSSTERVATSNEATQWVGPIEFISSDRHEAARLIVKWATQNVGRHVHLANAYTVALADKSANYRGVLARPALNFPDGKPISWISAISRQIPRLEQIRGPQLFLDTFDQGRHYGIKHFLLGSTPEVLTALETNLKARFPGIIIAGAESPPFRPLSANEIDAQDSRIQASGADIVWVGLGTPKQDFEAQRLALRHRAVAVAIGAAFDFAAGSAKEAPSWMSAIGLEWLFRLSSEPRRLWRRYLFGNLRFLLAVSLSRHSNREPRKPSGRVT